MPEEFITPPFGRLVSNKRYQLESDDRILELDLKDDTYYEARVTSLALKRHKLAFAFYIHLKNLIPPTPAHSGGGMIPAEFTMSILRNSFQSARRHRYRTASEDGMWQTNLPINLFGKNSTTTTLPPIDSFRRGYLLPIAQSQFDSLLSTEGERFQQEKQILDSYTEEFDDTDTLPIDKEAIRRRLHGDD